MLHAKFHGHWSTDSGEEVLKVLPYMGVVATWVMWPGQFEHIFVSDGYIWNMVTIGLLAFEEMFEIVKLW